MLESSERKYTTRLPSLTGMRLIAALLVFFTHASIESVFSDQGVASWTHRFLEPGGRYGVSFFFVLSGFVLTWSAGPRDSVWGFWRRRLAKIYPLHVVTWAMALVLLATVKSPGLVLNWHVATLNLALLHAWFPWADTMVSINAPSWSLCCEALFYLAFPLIIWIVRKIRPAMLWPAALFAVAVVMCTPLFTELLPQQPVIPGYNVTFYGSWFMKVFPLAHLFEFVVGILMARIVLAGRWINLGFTPAAILAICDYYAVAKVPMFYSFAAAGIIPLALLVPAAAEADRRATTTWGLRSKAMVRLGEISFAFYMVHWMVLHYGHRIIGPTDTWSTPAALGLWAAAFVIALIAAWLLHEGVEMPVMRRWSRPRQRPEGATAGAGAGQPVERPVGLPPVPAAARPDRSGLDLD